MGECPTWYLTIKAARYLGVPPWDLVEQPQVWQAMALESEASELQAESEMRKRKRS